MPDARQVGAPSDVAGGDRAGHRQAWRMSVAVGASDSRDHRARVAGIEWIDVCIRCDSRDNVADVAAVPGTGERVGGHGFENCGWRSAMKPRRAGQQRTIDGDERMRGLMIDQR